MNIRVLKNILPIVFAMVCCAVQGQQSARVLPTTHLPIQTIDVSIDRSVVNVIEYASMATRLHTAAVRLSTRGENLLLAAHAVGLGSCWINRATELFDMPEGKALLKKWGLDEKYRGVGHCILGYADGSAPAPRPRKEDYIVRV